MNQLSKWDQEKKGWKGGPSRGPGRGAGAGDTCVTLGAADSYSDWAFGLHAALINTSGQFSNAPGLIKPKAQFVKCFLPHLNCLDCVEFNPDVSDSFKSPENALRLPFDVEEGF